MTRITRNIPADCCCDSWKKGIRTINGQYPDDNREFGIMEGAGILITPVTAGIKITNSSDPGALQAGQNIQLTPVGDHLEIATTDNINVNGNLNVDGDIIQQGASYETHMEQVYTTNDYITMRDGAVSALPNGQYSGFQVKKYDGTNDGRLVIDNTGTARVGDVGDEQPLLTRVESGSLVNGQILRWDSVNSRAYGMNVDNVPTDGSSNPVMSDGVYDALAGKGIVNTTNIYAFGSTTVPAATITNVQTVTLTEAGTYLLLGVVSSSTAMSSGLSVKGFTIGGSLAWISTNSGTGDGQYASFMRIATVPANTVVDMTVYFSAQAVTISGEMSVVRLT